MQFNRRNINKRLRNGDIISSSLYSSNSSGGSSSGGILSGNYLPATQNADGTYTVDLTQVNFNGNVIASGEVSAYRIGSSSGSTGTSSSGSVTIYDGLDSDSATIALSANQGRVLKNLIDTMGGDVDLSDYYTKDQIDDKLSNVDIDLSDYLKTTTFNTHTESTVHITPNERTNWNTAYNSSHSHSNKSVLDGISSTNVTNWNGVVSDWNDVFSINSDGSLRVKVNLYGDGEVSAFGSGATSTDINLENYYTKTQIDNMFDTLGGNVDIDLSEYSKTSHTHNDLYYTETEITNLLKGKSDSGHTHTDYPTLSSLGAVASSTFTAHTASTVHITPNERTNWNTAYNSSHSHSNKSVIDGISSTNVSNWNTAFNNNHSHTNKTQLDTITSTKITNWDKVVSDWDKIFSINSDGSLKVKVNLYGDGEVSAFGSGATSTDINLGNYYTKDQIDGMFNTMGGSVDLSEYSKTSHTHSNATTSASGLMSASDKSKLDGITSSADSVSFSRSLTAGTKVGTITINGTGTDIYCETNTNTTYSNATTSASGLMSASDKSKLDGITSSADSVSFTRSLTAGTKVGTITINGTATDLYCEKNTDTNTTYSNATTSASGLMSASDKSKLDGITSSADSVSFTRSLTAGTKVGTITINGTATDLYCEKNTDTNTTYSVVGANGSTGLVKNGSSVTNASGYIACPIVGGVPYYKDTNTTYSLSSFDITATAAELNYCDGVTSNIQTQLNSKSPSGHSHNYAGSSSAGGAATSANKLNTNGGSSTQPVYFSNGVPVTCTTYANASVNYANSAGSAGSATNATTASKLSTVSKTAWGQTFWTSGGIPTSISGNMTGVGSITASGNITTSAEVTAHSDVRLKTNIKPLTVRGTLNPVQYVKDGKESIGFIANEVQELYPELVIVDESSDEKYLSLNYQQLTAVLYAEIQELKNEITELKNKHKWL